MTDRQIEYVPLDSVVPAEANPKRHDLSEIRASMARFGYTEPLLMDGRTGRLVAGHGRLETLAAAKAGGLPAPDGVRVEDGRWLVPIVTGWASADDAEAEAYLVASNRLVEAGGWDDGMLADMLVDLRGTSAGLSGVGFDDAALDELLASLGRDVPVSEHTRHIGDPDDVPEPPEEPVTKPGDLWLLGPHRLLCGDATSAEDHDRAIGGYAGVDLVLTDPPYGIGVDYGERASDDRDDTLELIERVMPLLLLHPAVLLTPGMACMWAYPPPAWVLGWVHPASNSSGPWGFNSLNPILAYGKDPYLAAGMGRRPTALVLAADREGEVDHPVAKPIKVWAWLLDRGTALPGRTVLDPFMGSGTTLVACELAGHRAMGIELEPRWVDATCARWERLTGEKPVLESTGEPHSFLG